MERVGEGGGVYFKSFKMKTVSIFFFVFVH